MAQERMLDNDRAKVTSKKEAKKLSNVDKNKVDKNREFGKTIHCCDKYVTQCVFETAGKLGIWEGCWNL